jgi:hypothetical protein
MGCDIRGGLLDEVEQGGNGDLITPGLPRRAVEGAPMRGLGNHASPFDQGGRRLGLAAGISVWVPP